MCFVVKSTVIPSPVKQARHSLVTVRRQQLGPKIEFWGRLGTAQSQIAVYNRYRGCDRSGDTSGNVFDLQVCVAVMLLVKTEKEAK
ncbi:MAG: hypothetical protein GDA56_04090 [Hormoscilla sp. GM7CHS1pb]|nr:hypothetical protein [Hormoscilla sp. GM7CHS1pb]